MIPLVGYAPDVDPTTQGVLTNCSAFIPSDKGMEAAPGALSSGVDTLAAACRGTAVLRQLDNTTRMFAGTSSNIYELSGTSWTSRSSGHSLATGEWWRYAVQGNIELAVCKSVKLMSSTTAAFSTVTKAGTDAPKASIVETVGDFVFLADYDDGTDTPDGVFWSAQGDYTDWTPSLATQCGNQRLYGSPGKITAAKRFGDSIVIYKRRHMYIGQYPTEFIWSFIEIPGDTGALSQEVVVNTGTSEQPLHIFMGYEDFYIFDGARPQPVGEPVRDTVFGEINRAKDYLCQALHDRFNGRIYFFYPVGETLDKCVVYNYRSNRWGRDDRSIQAVVEYISSGVTYDNLGNDYTTYDDFPGTTYDTSFLGGDSSTISVFDNSNDLKFLTGTPGASSFTTGDWGDDSSYSLLSRVKPRFLQAPASAECTNYYRDNLGDSLTTDKTVGMVNSRFDMLRESRWHRVRLSFTGATEITGVKPDLMIEGDE